MDLNRGLDDLVAVALVAALAPLVVAVLPGPRIPQVVIFLVGGVLIGPHVLGVAETSNIELLSNIGLGFLFLLAGYELDPQLFRRRPGELAITGWLISGALAVGITAGLAAAGYIRDYVPVGLALTTTALGTLLPILRDNDMLGGQFGQYIFAAGAVGELFPIVVIAVFLTQRGHFVALASVAAVGVLALALSTVPWLARSSTVQRVIQEGQDATGQITLRWAVVLLFLLLAAASRFGLDVVLGAMLAGIVLRTWTRRLNIDTSGLEDKFDAVGYGVFIPIFFISSGMTLDLKAISEDPLRLLLFFLLLLIVRGLPSLVIYRRALATRQRVEMVFITATSLPLLIALAEIGEHDGVMLPATAAALVGAGVLSVLVYPLIAVGLHRSAPLSPTDLGIAPAEMAAGTGAPPEIPGPPGQDSQGALAAAISAGSKPSTTGTGTGTGTGTATATATATIISTPLTEIATRHPAEMLSLMAGTRQARNRVPVSVYRPWAPNVWLGHAVSGLKSCPAISGPAARLRDSGNFAH
jgi:Kef-type K+ transport system membrane component KefB